MTTIHVPRNWAQRASQAIHDESGVAKTASMFMMVSALTLGGLAIDYANGVRTKAQIQVVADAAALAGIARLPDGPEAARDAAFAHAERHGSGLLSMADIEVGNWTDGGFTSGQATPDAIRVVTRRDENNANPLPTFLMSLVGVSEFNIVTPTIVVREEARVACSGGGYFARGMIDTNSNNRYFDGFCLHGEAGVDMNNNNYFDIGTRVTSPDTVGVTSYGNNPGLAEAVRSASHDFSFTEDLGDYIAEIREYGILSEALPDYVLAGPIHVNQINAGQTLQRNALYIVDGDVTLRGDRYFEEVAVIATGDIRIPSNVTLRNVVLVSEGEISTVSNVEIGGHPVDYCEQETYSAYLLARGDISFNSNNTLRGIFVSSQGDVQLNSNFRANEGVYIEALGDISYNSNAEKFGCGSGFENALRRGDDGPSIPRLVY